MSRIRQFGVGVDEATFARVERLRACMGESRSRVIDMALTRGGLDSLEKQYARRTETFNMLARRAGQTWEEFALAYGREYSHQTYPPTVEKLERELDGRGEAGAGMAEGDAQAA